MAFPSGETVTNKADFIVQLAEMLCATKHPQEKVSSSPCVLCITLAATMAPTVLNNQTNPSESHTELPDMSRES